jgi:mannose-6-phosphate isomerase-like protein (cupin superfamily)
MPNTKYLINEIDKLGGKIILTTGRKESMRKITEEQLSSCGIFFDQLIMGCNRGTRILINDLKPSQTTKTAAAFTPKRNKLDELEIEKILKPSEERPWGSFSTLSYNEKYHIKEIKINPNCSSSLQSHQYRNELWLVISGKGIATINSLEKNVEQGSVIHVNAGEKHRVSCTGEEDLIFIEIQTGEKFSEDDITRYEDQYGRV